MTDQSFVNSCENGILIGKQNDVVSLQQPILETEALPSVEQTVNNKPLLIEDTEMCGSAVDVVKFKEQSASTSVENDCNLLNNAKPRGKRRRRKSNRSKQKSNNTPYKKSNWKFQMPRTRGEEERSGLVPYNTNKFLMEEHMPEAILGRVSPSGRTRNSSFSVDSEDYFNALPEDEEAFLTKEFSSVYETARAERLDGMSKNQLIKEYLQLEATYDKLSKTLGARVSSDVDAKAKDFESKNVICRLEERVKQLTEENLELRRRMADIRNRGQRSHSHGSHYTISSSSEDSESDSTTSSSNTSRSRSRSNSSSGVEVIDMLNCNSNHTQMPLE
ncbi:protein HEXIM1 [Bradysia coprophila]|uniref:protein HEXIM1 n=1 Tax=Bradysia coprophila TaxID=38358 RepID=UPI00187DB95B|nr:protein HEXIM1 [Bradysia coprophila]